MSFEAAGQWVGRWFDLVFAHIYMHWYLWLPLFVLLFMLAMIEPEKNNRAYRYVKIILSPILMPIYVIVTNMTCHCDDGHGFIELWSSYLGKA